MLQKRTIQRSTECVVQDKTLTTYQELVHRINTDVTDVIRSSLLYPSIMQTCVDITLKQIEFEMNLANRPVIYCGHLITQLSSEYTTGSICVHLCDINDKYIDTVTFNV